MTEDARFEDANYTDQPLKLRVEDAEDVPVISSLVQDAVGLTGEISWMPRRRRLALLVNRFRWEDREQAAKQRRKFERVRSALLFDDVLSVRSSGLTPAEKDTIYSMLQIRFDPAEDGTGILTIDIAGDGALELSIECLNGQLIDLTKPWEAKSGAAPAHDLD